MTHGSPSFTIKLKTLS